MRIVLSLFQFYRWPTHLGYFFLEGLAAGGDDVPTLSLYCETTRLHSIWSFNEYFKEWIAFLRVSWIVFQALFLAEGVEDNSPDAFLLLIGPGEGNVFGGVAIESCLINWYSSLNASSRVLAPFAMAWAWTAWPACFLTAAFLNAFQSVIRAWVGIQVRGIVS